MPEEPLDMREEGGKLGLWGGERAPASFRTAGGSTERWRVYSSTPTAGCWSVS